MTIINSKAPTYGNGFDAVGSKSDRHAFTNWYAAKSRVRAR